MYQVTLGHRFRSPPRGGRSASCLRFLSRDLSRPSALVPPSGALARDRDRAILRDRSRWSVGAAFAPPRSARAASRAPKSGSGAATSAMAAGAGAGTSKRDFLAGAGAGAAPRHAESSGAPVVVGAGGGVPVRTPPRRRRRQACCQPRSEP